MTTNPSHSDQQVKPQEKEGKVTKWLKQLFDPIAGPIPYFVNGKINPDLRGGDMLIAVYTLELMGLEDTTHADR